MTSANASSAAPNYQTGTQPLSQDLSGNLRVVVSAGSGSPANLISGSTTSTDTAAHQIIAAPGSGLKNYVTSLQVFRTDAGTTLVYGTLNDTASTTIPFPPLSGAAITLPSPLVWAANTAVTITMSAGVTTAYASAQGYKGA